MRTAGGIARYIVFAAIGVMAGWCISSSAFAAVERVVCVPWQGDPLKYHTGISGQAIGLNAVVRTTDGGQIWYKWVFGDGTESPVGTLSGALSYDISVEHVYQGSVGTPFTARLLVDATDSSLSHSVSDNYIIKIEPSGLDARVNIAVDNGLWYLHTHKSSYPLHLSMSGKPVAAWLQTSYGWYTAAPTASAIQAFQINGHKQTGDPDEDPYVLDVQYGFNFLFTGYVDNTDHPLLQRVGIGLQDGNDPDSNHNGVGIQVRDWDYRPIYQGGMVIDAIIASGTPNADSGRDFDGDGINDSYRKVVQDMCDMYAWGQYFGGWRYGWRDFPDNSAAQWGAIALIPAQQSPWNCIVPSWVKTQNNSWLDYSHGISGVYGGFGYTGASFGDATTPGGMVQLDFVGATRDDPRWVRCERWFADSWSSWINNYNFYAYYAFAKAMRLANPAPITTFASSGLDWYRGDDRTIGLAQRVSDGLIANHSWSSPWADPSLATAFAVIILRPVLFQEAPIACFTAQPNPNYPDLPVEFDPACSGHSDPAKSRSNLVLYEWDWNSDGVFDEASNTPEVRKHAFACVNLPCVQAVTLRVTDDVGNQATYRQDIQITNPPHPPVARIAGPFWVSLCDLDGLVLDASGSFDVDQGQHEGGCVSCPGDGITAYRWDLDGAPFEFTGPTGAVVDLGTDFRQSFGTPGIYDIGVQVSDNTALAFPGSGKPNLTDDEFTQVWVYSEGVCNLNLVPHCEGVDVSWDPVADATYTVYVSALGANRGFAIAAQGDNPSVSLDGFPLGVPRWIRVAALVGGQTLMSEAVKVVSETAGCLPVADAGGPYRACAGKPVKLSAAKSVGKLGNIVSAEWDLDNDGSFDDASGIEVEHVFGKAGVYPIRVRVSSGGSQVLSNEARATVTVELCECIEGLTARPKLNKVQLTWKAASETAAYNVYRSTSPWFTPSEATLIAKNVVTSFAVYVDGNLNAGVTYYYKVSRVTAAGVEVCYSNEARITPMPRTGNVPPAANAGPDQVVEVGTTVTLDGSGSFDANNQAINYKWTLKSKPASSSASMTGNALVKPTFKVDVRGAYEFELIVNDGLVDSTPDTVRVTTRNTAPEADPGSDREVAVGTEVKLDAFKSKDADGDPMTFRWLLRTRPDASSAQILEPNAQQTSFVADAKGVYEIDLIANDGIVDSLPVRLTIRTVNSPPVARIVAKRVVAVGEAVKLDGTSSSDIDGDVLTFRWSLAAAPTGSGASVQNSTSPVAGLSPDKAGEFQLQLVTSDGVLSSAPALVVVTANAAPVANAGPDQETRVGIEVLLDGAGSSDPEQDPLTYRWVVAESPVGSVAEVKDGTSAKARLTPDRKGQYVLKLVVNDGHSDSLADEVIVAVVNTAPVAVAGADLEVNVGQVVALNGTGSKDADGDQLSYAWTLTERPAGSAAALDDKTSATPKFTADVPGTYTAELVVSDAIATSTPSTVHVVTVNRLPVANAGLGQSHFVGDSFALDGTGSSDPDGDSLTFAWSVSVKPNGSSATPSNAASPTPKFVPDLAGVYQLRLVVSDGRGGTSESTVNLSANPFVLTTDLTGLTEKAARDAIENLGAHVGAVTRRSDEQIPSGIVLQQVPPAGTKTPPGGSVDLVISSGPDVQPPVVTVSATPVFVRIGETVTLTVTVTDDGLTTAPILTVDGLPQILIGNQATFICTASGSFHAVATASDAVGNVGQGETSFFATDPSDTTPPTVVITAPANNTEITKSSVVMGSVFDPAGQFAYYTVEYAPVERVDLSTLDSSDFVEIARGTSEIHDDVLATFDATLLSNDSYLIRVSGWDQNGQGRREAVVVNVSGNLKLGNFHIEFTDLAIPVAGIPIQVTRIYDTLQAAYKGDFGHGWRLGLRDARIVESGKKLFVGFEEEMVLTTSSKIYINTPDGRRVGFKVEPQFCAGAIFFGAFYKAVFTPDPGVYETLEAEGNDCAFKVDDQGRFVNGFLPLTALNPSVYRLTMKDGTVYQYSKTEGLQRVTDLNGNRLVFNSEGIFHFSAGSSVPDQKIDFVRDANGNIVQVIDPNGNTIQYAYDADGNLSSMTDQVANKTQYHYRTKPTHYLSRIVDFLGRDALKTEYDTQGRLVAIRDASGNPITQEFDQANNIVRFHDAMGNLQVVQYDQNGNEVMKAVPGVYTNHFAFDSRNNEIWRKDGRGFVTTHDYDNRGNPTNIIDALGNVTTVSYNLLNKPTIITDPLGRRTQFVYNTSGQLISVVNPINGSASFTWDGQGRVNTVTDFNGHTVAYDYAGGCSCGVPSKIVNADGTFRTYESDSLGLITREIDELGNESRSEYDAIGRLIKKIDAEGNTTSYSYSGKYKVSETDSLGRTIKYGYDVLNRLVAITNAMGGVARFEYDNGTNRTAIIDPLGNITRFYYDSASRLTHQVDPLGRTNVFSYDASGNRTESIDRNGHRRTFTYDGMNRRTSEMWWEGANQVRSINYTFNALGMMIDASDPSSRLMYEYDALNRVKQTTQSQVANLPDFILKYTHDALGNVVTVEDNLSTRVASTYNSRNQLTRRVWTGDALLEASLSFDYDAAGNLASVQRYSDASGNVLAGQSRHSFSPVGLVTNILHSDGNATAIAQYSYLRDGSQQIVSRAISNKLITFGYDQAGQLTNAIYSGGQTDEHYLYDKNGNRANNGYLVGAYNQLITDGTDVFSYDNEGNLVSRSNKVTHVSISYRYDHRNRLLSVTEKDPSEVDRLTVEFEYDALNRRIAKRVNGVLTRFLLEQQSIWADTDGDGKIIARYLLGNSIDEMLARFRPGEDVIWYLADSLGSVHDLVDSAGTVVNHVTYDSFGRILNQTSDLHGDRFLFTGREYDGETGLYYFRARYYDPGMNRFMNLDPLGFDSGEFNAYSYVGNAPTVATDPLGLVTMVERAIQEIRRTVDKKLLQCLGREVALDVATTGIYIYIAGGVPYVGQSVDIDRRLSEHARKLANEVKLALKEVARVAVPSDQMNKWEKWILCVVVEYYNLPCDDFKDATRNRRRTPKWSEVISPCK